MQSSSQIITTNIPTSSFLQPRCPYWCPTNGVKALKEVTIDLLFIHKNVFFLTIRHIICLHSSRQINQTIKQQINDTRLPNAHSLQPRTEKDGDTEKGCQQQKTEWLIDLLQMNTQPSQCWSTSADINQQAAVTDPVGTAVRQLRLKLITVTRLSADAVNKSDGISVAFLSLNMSPTANIPFNRKSQTMSCCYPL